MIKICILDSTSDNFEKLKSLFTRTGMECTVRTSVSPSEVMNEIVNSGFHVLLFPKNLEITPGLAFRTVLINLKSSKAPLVSLVTSNLFNSLDLIANIEQVNFVPEVPGINLIMQVMGHVEELLKNPKNVALQKKVAPKPQIDTAKTFTVLMNVFMESINHYLEGYLKTQSKRESFYVKSENDPSGDISSVLSISSQYFEGSIAISFKDKLFLDFASVFMKEKILELNEDCRDIITEMIVEISEEFTRKMKTQNIHISASIPMVMIGKNHKIKHISTGKIICLKFALGQSSYALEFLFQAKT